MNPSNKINFTELRDIGQIYNSTFSFVRQNKGLIFKSITAIVMPFILLGAIFIMYSGFMLIKSFDEMEFMTIASYWLLIMVGVLFVGIGGINFLATNFELIEIYKESDDYTKINLSDVWKRVKANFWTWLGRIIVWGIFSSTLSSIAYILALIFFLPASFVTTLGGSFVIGIILMIIGYIVMIILMAYVQSIGVSIFYISSSQNKDIIQAIGKAFQLMHTKGNFWKGIFATLTGNAVQYILTYTIMFPFSIILLLIGANFTEYFDGASIQENKIVLIAFAVFLPLYYITILYSSCIYLIAQAFKTDDLNERTFGANILKRIQQMGKKESTNHSNPESY